MILSLRQGGEGSDTSRLLCDLDREIVFVRR